MSDASDDPIFDGISLPDFLLRPHKETPRVTILPEAALMELEANMADFIHEPGRCRFKVGDTVIPKPNGLVACTDKLPRKVVAVNLDAPYRFEGEPGSASYGLRSDIRVLCYHGDTLAAFWTESSYYQLYESEK